MVDNTDVVETPPDWDVYLDFRQGVDPGARNWPRIADLRPVVANDCPKNIPYYWGRTVLSKLVITHWDRVAHVEPFAPPQIRGNHIAASRSSFHERRRGDLLEHSTRRESTSCSLPPRRAITGGMI